MNIKYKFIILVALVLFFIAGGVYLIQWHKQEYPSGTVMEETDRINIFFCGWYCDRNCISFDNVYEFKDYDLRFKLFNILEDQGIEYNISFALWCDDKEEIIITFNETLFFEITYYTYDRMSPGNELHYIKTKVVTSLKVKD